MHYGRWQRHGDPLHGRPDRAEAFWKRVEKQSGDGCWLWMGSLGEGGYGQTSVANRSWRAHRYSWELTNGPIPTGMVVCHNCDQNYPAGDISYRRCVRPDHLFLGEHIDNMADMREKRRAASGKANGKFTHPEKRLRGERNGRSKLSPAEVIALRARYAEGGISLEALGSVYGITSPAAWRVVTGKTWSHI